MAPASPWRLPILPWGPLCPRARPLCARAFCERSLASSLRSWPSRQACVRSRCTSRILRRSFSARPSCSSCPWSPALVSNTLALTRTHQLLTACTLNAPRPGFLFAAQCYKDQHPTNLYLTLGFTVSLAWGVAVTCARFQQRGLGLVVLEAVGLTASVTAALTVYTLRSKADFSFLGAGLGAGLWVLILGGLVASLTGLSSMHFALSVGPLFSRLSPRHLTPPHATSRHLTPSHAIWRLPTPCHRWAARLSSPCTLCTTCTRSPSASPPMNTSTPPSASTSTLSTYSYISYGSSPRCSRATSDAQKGCVPCVPMDE